MMDTGFEPSPFTWQASTLSTKPSRRTAQHATKLTNKACPVVNNMYYNKSYLGKTSYSIVSDNGKYALRTALSVNGSHQLRASCSRPCDSVTKQYNLAPMN